MNNSENEDNTPNSQPPAKRGFKKGKSGNPAGRPKGSRNRTTELKLAIEAGMVSEAKKDAMDVYHKTVELALDGDTACIKILMDRMWPATGHQNKNEQKGIGGINIIVQEMPKVEVVSPIEGELENE